MIVLDASAAVLGLLNDGEARAKLASEAVACPHLVDSEVVHALRGQVLRREVDVEAATRAVEVWARTGTVRNVTSATKPSVPSLPITRCARIWLASS